MTFTVVRNDEDQYSIGTVWTDMRPRNLRERMATR